MSQQPANPLSRVARGTGELLVTGATGLLGRAVARALHERGLKKWRALVRVSSDREVLSGTGAWMIEGDLLRPRSLTNALEDVTTVLHLAGAPREKDPAAIRAAHVDATANLLAATTATRIVAISSDTVLRSKRSAYAEAKAEADRLLLEWGQGEGRSVVILRPPMMLGPGSPHLASLERAAKLPVVPVPAHAGRRRPVFVGDVAKAVLAAMDLAEADVPDRPIDLPGAFAVPIPVLIKGVARAHGWKEPRIVSVPPGALKGVGRLARKLGKDDLTDERIDGLAEEVDPDPKMARHRLGWRPVTLDETLRQSISKEPS